MADQDLVVIPLPLDEGGVTYAVARLVEDGGKPFAEGIVAVPGTALVPGKRIALSSYSLSRIRPGALEGRPDLYFYEGMILPPPKPLN
jgi:hypothetical protein